MGTVNKHIGSIQGTVILLVVAVLAFGLIFCYASKDKKSGWIFGNKYLEKETEESEQKLFRMVSGTVNLNNNTATLDPIFTFKRPFVEPPLPQIGPYFLQQLDREGRVLHEVPFAPSVPVYDDFPPVDLPPDTEEPKPDDIGVFVILVPAVSSASEVRVVFEEETLAKMVASPNHPTVDIVYPSGGELIDENIEIRWEASDPDQEELTFAIFYSSDGGGTWEALTTKWPHNSYTAIFSYLEQSEEALIKILATDGFNTAEAASEPFFVASQPPTLSISSPKDGWCYIPTQHVFLEAYAYDKGNGRLDEDSIEWFSDIDGLLGTGSQVDFRAQDVMSEGKHTVTVRAVNSRGDESTESVEIAIDLWCR